jgi:hypothetical protein
VLLARWQISLTIALLLTHVAITLCDTQANVVWDDEYSCSRALWALGQEVSPEDLVRTRGKNTNDKEALAEEDAVSAIDATADTIASANGDAAGNSEEAAAVAKADGASAGSAEKSGEISELEMRRKQILESLNEDAKGHENPQLRWRLVPGQNGKASLLIRCATKKDYKRFGAKKPPQYVPPRRDRPVSCLRVLLCGYLTHFFLQVRCSVWTAAVWAFRQGTRPTTTTPTVRATTTADCAARCREAR